MHAISRRKFKRYGMVLHARCRMYTSSAMYCATKTEFNRLLRYSSLFSHRGLRRPPPVSYPSPLPASTRDTLMAFNGMLGTLLGDKDGLLPSDKKGTPEGSDGKGGVPPEVLAGLLFLEAARSMPDFQCNDSAVSRLVCTTLRYRWFMGTPYVHVCVDSRLVDGIAKNV